MFALNIAEKTGGSRVMEFDKNEVTIGRIPGNDIVLAKGNISKHHGRIVFKDGKFIVVDLKSTNGTFVNGKKIAAPQVLKTSDKVFIGDYILNVMEAEEGAHDEEGSHDDGEPRGRALRGGAGRRGARRDEPYETRSRPRRGGAGARAGSDHPLAPHRARPPRRASAPARGAPRRPPREPEGKRRPLRPRSAGR